MSGSMFMFCGLGDRDAAKNVLNPDLWVDVHEGMTGRDFWIEV